MLLRAGSLLDAPPPTGVNVRLAFRGAFPLSRLLVPAPSSVSEWDRESLSVERLLRLLDLVLADDGRLPVRTLKSRNDSFPNVFGRFPPPCNFLLASSIILVRRLPELGVDSPFPGEGGGARVGYFRAMGSIAESLVDQAPTNEEVDVRCPVVT